MNSRSPKTNIFIYLFIITMAIICMIKYHEIVMPILYSVFSIIGLYVEGRDYIHKKKEEHFLHN